jgi:hypothetical protein
MGVCAAACAVSVPPAYTAGCGVTQRQGGVHRLVFIACDYTFTDITDPAEWAQAITDGDVVISGALLGQKPKGTATKKKTSSCAPEAVVGYERSITAQDFNADPNYDLGGIAATYRDFAFWNTLMQNSAKYKFGFVTCDQRFYGVFNNFTLEADQVIPESSTDPMYWDVAVAFSGITLPEPTKLTFIDSL